MYGVRGGRRRPFLAAFPSIAGRSSGNGGGTAAESGQREPQSGRVSTGAVPQPSIEVTARVTAVIDPCSFWAQVGEDTTLAEFDRTMAELSEWCEKNGEGATHLPRVNELLCVKGAEPGEWVRARVSRQVSESVVEVVYVDTGTSGRVELPSVCAVPPPQLYTVPYQGLQCSLAGALPVDDGEVWCDKAIKRFSQLVTGEPVKAVVATAHVMGLTLHLYTKNMESVLNILVAEGLARADQTAVQVSSLSFNKADTGKEEEEYDEAEVIDTSSMPPLSGAGPLSGVTAEPLSGVTAGTLSGAAAEPLSGVTAGTLSGAAAEPLSGVTAGPLSGVAAGPLSGVAAESKREEESVSEEKGDVKSEAEAAVEEESAVKPATVEPSASAHSGVKGATEVEDEEREKDGGEKSGTSTADDSEDEWDESLLEDTTLELQKDAVDNLFALDPFSPPQPHQQRQRNSLPGEVMSRGRGEWSGDRWGRGKAWRGGGRRGGGERYHYGGRSGTRDGGWREVGSERGRGRGNWTRRGGGGRARSNFDEARGEVQQQQAGRPSGEVTGRSTFSAAKETTESGGEKLAQPPPPVKELPLSLSPAPPSTRPVQLFPRGERETVTTRHWGATEELRLADMKADVAGKEVDWHNWKLGNHVEKIVKGLTLQTASRFGAEMQEILSSHSSAEKLIHLPGSRGPIWPVLTALLAEGAKRKEGEEKAIVVALRSLVAVLCVDVCQLIQPVIENMATDICRPVFSEQAVRARQAFCSFIGKLFLDASYTTNRDYAAVMGKIVRHFLNTWSKCPAEGHEGQLLTEVQCFGLLCKQIGPTLDVTNREVLEQYFSGIVRKHILSVQLPCSVKECLLDLSLERAAGWREAAEQKTKIQPSTETTSTPVFSQTTPTHSANGQRVVHPLPVASSETNMPCPPITSPHPLRGPAGSVSDNHLPQSLYQHQPPLVARQTSTPLPGSLPLSQPLSHRENGGMHFPSSLPGTSQVAASNLPPPSGIQPANNTSYVVVQAMLSALRLEHLTECFRRAAINDSVIDVGSTDFLRAGLKDAGLQPGEVVCVLDYLERRQRGRQPSQSVPSSPLIPPSPSSSSYLSRQSSFPHPYSPSASSSLYTPSTHQSATPSNHPDNIMSPAQPHSMLATPHHHRHLVNSAFGFPGNEPPSSPTLSVTPVGGVETGSATQNPGTQPQRFGFGQYSCVLCRSQEHSTYQCPDRHQLLFQHNSIY